MIDTHTHLNFPELVADLDMVLARAKNAGVSKFIVPGTTIEDSTSGVNLCEFHEELYAAVGVHPTDARDFGEAERNQLKELLGETNKVVSIGEVGLDYYHFEDLKTAAEIEEYKNIQKDVFRLMVQLAGEYNLPLIVHSREAYADTERDFG